MKTVMGWYNHIEACWTTPKGPRKFGIGGIQSFLLDMHFLLRVFDAHVSTEANDLSNDICERALRSYFSQNKDLSTPLQTDDFYDKRVEAAMVEYNF